MWLHPLQRRYFLTSLSAKAILQFDKSTSFTLSPVPLFPLFCYRSTIVQFRLKLMLKCCDKWHKWCDLLTVKRRELIHAAKTSSKQQIVILLDCTQHSFFKCAQMMILQCHFTVMFCIQSKRIILNAVFFCSRAILTVLFTIKIKSSSLFCLCVRLWTQKK